MNAVDFKTFIDKDSYFQSALDKMLKERAVAESNLTRDQFIDCMFQALSCGDFIRHVMVYSDSQAVIYVPFQREQELESKVKNLTQQIQSLGLTPWQYPPIPTQE